MKHLERLLFCVAVACMSLSAGEAIAQSDDPETVYVTCKKSPDGASCNTATAGKACGVNKTCSATATQPCVCI
jgi:hypothetical protein